MIIITTVSDSVYEIDEENKRIRRLMGNQPPTPNQPADGEWKAYKAISPPETGKRMAVVWGVEAGDGKMVIRQTWTANVKIIERPRKRKERE